METNINTIGENLSDFDVIINTVPHLVLTEEPTKFSFHEDINDIPQVQ